MKNFHTWLFLKSMAIMLLYSGSSMLRAQCLNGSYTIGGASPSFATFAAAANALKTQGVCGPVSFKVRDGVYSEDILIKKIPGASAVNRVTFEPASGDSSKVGLQNANNYSQLSIVTLDSASYVTFKKIVFRRATEINYACLAMTNGACYNSILSCTFFIANAQVDYPSYNDNASIVTITNTGSVHRANNHNTISHNIFYNGTFGLSLNNNLNTWRDTANAVTYNRFYNQKMSCAYAQNQSKFKFNGNVVSSTSNTYTPGNYTLDAVVNMPLAYDSVEICNNSIYKTETDNGIVLNLGPSAKALLINNFIYTKMYTIGTGSGSAMTLNTPTGSVTRLYNNTIRCQGPNGYGMVFINNYGTFSATNNIFYSEGGSKALTLYNYGSGVYSGAHNDFYSQGPGLLEYGQTTYTSLPSFQAAQNNDLSSYNRPLLFYGNSYHLYGKGTDSLGTPLSQVATDIDGNLRDIANPDIGCSEYLCRKNDAGLTAMNQGAFNCPGVSTASVTIKNYGTDTLYSVQIGCVVNQVLMAPFTYTVKIAPNDSAVNVAVCSYTNASGGVPLMKLYPMLVNGLPDSVAYNDTIYYNRILGPLRGDYVIGITGRDFKTLNEAKTALMSYGICGPVTFYLQRGTYLERTAFGAVAGASPANTITFRPLEDDANSVQVVGYTGNSSIDYIIQVNHAAYYIFKKLAIMAFINDHASPAYDTNPFQVNYSHRIQVDSCKLTSSGPAQPGDFNSADLQSLYSDSLVLTHSEFRDSNYGIYYLDNLYTANNTISHNIISNTTYGIYMDHAGSSEISYNICTGADSTRGTGLYAIQSKNVRIFKNRVYNFSTGMRLGSITSTNGPAMVYNNFINNTCLVAGCDGVQLLHNNFYMGVSNPGSTNGACIDFQSNTNLVVKNNIFSNISNYWNSQALFLYPSLYQFTALDYNAYYTPHVPFMNYVTTYSTIAQWNNYSSFDQHSILANPGYVNVFSDLHMTNSTLAFMGTNVGITDDIDGYTRMSPPTIGANEINGIPTALSPAMATQPELSFSPNPFDTETEVRYTPVNDLLPAAVTIYDQMGHTVASEPELRAINGVIRYVFRPGSLPNGIYLLKVSAGGQSFTAKLAYIR